MNFKPIKPIKKFPSRSSTKPPMPKPGFKTRLASKGPDVGRESLPARVPKKGKHNPMWL